MSKLNDQSHVLEWWYKLAEAGIPDETEEVSYLPQITYLWISFTYFKYTITLDFHVFMKLHLILTDT